jgi:hypothetical protein
LFGKLCIIRIGLTISSLKIRIGLVARICRSQLSKDIQCRQGRGSIPRFGKLTFCSLPPTESPFAYGRRTKLLLDSLTISKLECGQPCKLDMCSCTWHFNQGHGIYCPCGLPSESLYHLAYHVDNKPDHVDHVDLEAGRCVSLSLWYQHTGFLSVTKIKDLSNPDLEYCG